MIVGPARTTLAASIALLCLLAGGCESGSLKKVEQSESIFAVFGPPTPQEALAAMVDPHDADRRLRGTAMIAYAPFGGESVYVRYYVEAVQHDPDPGVRGVSARALGMHGTAEHAPLIIPLLEDQDRNVRQEAVRALQRLHNAAAIDPLIGRTRAERYTGNAVSATRVGEADAQIRADACTALGQYAETRVVQALITAIDDDQLVVNRAAAESLKVLTGQVFGEDQRAWLVWFAGTKEPFAARGTYTYPIFARDKAWFEYIPLMPPPPNESAATPVGLPTPEAAAASAAQQAPAPQEARPSSAFRGPNSN
jgi:hypothetical protein